MIGINLGMIPYKIRYQQLQTEQDTLLEEVSDLHERIYRQDPDYRDLYAEVTERRQRILEIDLEKRSIRPWWQKFFQID